MRDLKSNVDVVQSLAPASRTGAVNGSGVDLSGYQSAMVVFDLGAIGGTSPSFTFAVQESDDNVNYANVQSSDLDGTPPVATSGNFVARVGYRGNKRYLRAAITSVSGTSPTLVCSATVVRGRPAVAPLS